MKKKIPQKFRIFWGPDLKATFVQRNTHHLPMNNHKIITDYHIWRNAGACILAAAHSNKEHSLVISGPVGSIETQSWYC